jgi:hypothetical protein
MLQWIPPLLWRVLKSSLIGFTLIFLPKTVNLLLNLGPNNGIETISNQQVIELAQQVQHLNASFEALKQDINK